jgi:hypothetical protein
MQDVWGAINRLISENSYFHVAIGNAVEKNTKKFATEGAKDISISEIIAPDESIKEIADRLIIRLRGLPIYAASEIIEHISKKVVEGRS